MWFLCNNDLTIHASGKRVQVAVVNQTLPCFECFECFEWYLVIKKNRFWKRIQPQSGSFERRIIGQAQDLQIFKKLNMSQMNPKEFSTTLHTQFNYLT